jgi:hypothetical protein
MLKLHKSYFLTNKSEQRVDRGLGRLEQHNQSLVMGLIISISAAFFSTGGCFLRGLWRLGLLPGTLFLPNHGVGRRANVIAVANNCAGPPQNCLEICRFLKKPRGGPLSRQRASDLTD